MITPQEARQRTRTLVEHYVNECECRDLTDVKHVLTTLIGMAAQAIVATNGKEAALLMHITTQWLWEKLKAAYSLKELSDAVRAWKRQKNTGDTEQ
ncbi:hypothetical protein [Escherichia coli]|uniref:hypothetical protein n=1 Tax=Escherichia coli TaxID=562 RepID=UPI0010D85FE7|nr:hypothetical protein [Escherichia coli]GDO99220.1 hypothetical protein BvCmsNSNP012_01895 [Escherichia coli]